MVFHFEGNLMMTRFSYYGKALLSIKSISAARGISSLSPATHPDPRSPGLTRALKFAST
jgi:hypothetical protein